MTARYCDTVASEYLSLQQGSESTRPVNYGVHMSQPVPGSVPSPRRGASPGAQFHQRPLPPRPRPIPMNKPKLGPPVAQKPQHLMCSSHSDDKALNKFASLKPRGNLQLMHVLFELSSMDELLQLLYIHVGDACI